MTEIEFTKGLAMLKSYYLDWSFDVHNITMVKVWYKQFSTMDYGAFQDVLMNYMESSSYAPRSPVDIKNSIPRVLSVNDAWECIADVYTRCSNQQFFLNALNKEHPDLYKFANDLDFYTYEIDTEGNKCKGYHLKNIKNVFKKVYQDYLDTINIKYVGNQLTYNNNIKLLGETL